MVGTVIDHLQDIELTNCQLSVVRCQLSIYSLLHARQKLREGQPQDERQR